MVSSTPLTLIQRIRDTQDADSWREFVDLYEPLLLQYARKRGLSDTDARDAVQETLIRLLRVLPGFQLDHSKGRFRTWLWQVFMSAVNDQGRRSRTRQEAEEGYRKSGKEAVLPPEPPEWVKDHRLSVLKVVLARVKAQTQPKTWTCFEQHILLRRSGAEVAREVEITPNAVCVNAARVLAKVRERALEHMEDLDDGNQPLPG